MKTLTSIISIAFLASVALSAAGCGKSLPKLTDDQKAALGDTIQSASRGANATMNVGGANQRGSVMQGMPASAAWVGGIVGSSSSMSGDSTELKMEAKLKAAQNCKVAAVVPQMSTEYGSPYPSFDQAPSHYEATLTVSGDKCPMSLGFDFTMDSSQSGLSGKLTGQYQITDADIVAANDVNQATIDGSFSLSGDRSGGSIDASVKGSLVSQKHGNVTFTLTASGSGKSGDIVLDVVFPDFEAKLEQKIDGQDSTYSINGETVTEQEFYSYVQRTGVSARVSGRGAKM